MLSLRRRLVLIHLLATVATVGVTAAAGWWQLSRSVRGQLDSALLALADTEVGMLSDAGGAVVKVHESPAGSAPLSLTRLDRLVQIIDGNGRVLARSANLGADKLPVPARLQAQLAAGETIFDTLPDVREEPLRMVSVPVVVDGHRYAVQVAGSLDDADQILQSAAILFAVMATALLALVGWAGARLSRQTFVAMENIVDQARKIGDSSLDRRLPHPGHDDEIGHLVDTLNAMLGRIEQAFEAQRRFTADASHELRSPLSRLRTEIEITLRRPRSNEEYVGVLRSCLAEVGGLTMLVEELLMLARLDAGQQLAQVELASLASLASDAVTRLRGPAAERRIAIVLEDHLAQAVQVDRAPVSLVLRNLLENAMKFSPADGHVTVRLEHSESGVMLSVQDQGPGIAEQDLPFLFERFFRGSSARAGEVDGVGLGLALSQSIMQACGGRIDAVNAATGGARFLMWVPVAKI
ncbi:sensor histidine kinase [Janthinobacterium aquaticum]|uniref:sensor histidine kinase n=1 Tax=Janthinobacterium sp. FT58W TaxID=2654254 RepID=UPI0012642896|nr:ATP-binding protein [Janthinobacterium sp. FT58W]KAB8044221.1 HAMP domain-containing protein [Janthinobacterium sp. FT58W]